MIEKRNSSSDTACQKLKQSIANAGMNPPESVEHNRLMRFSPDGGTSKDGWYVFNPNRDGTAWWEFGNWKTGYRDQSKYVPDDVILTESQMNNWDLQIFQRRKELEQEKKEKYEDAETKARKLWGKAEDASPDHPYIKKKRITHQGLKQMQDKLIVPIYLDFADPMDRPVSLQLISEAGDKQFLAGGKIQGCHHTIGDPAASDVIYIAEGYATGETIKKATGCPVIVAFNAGNMKAACEKALNTFEGKRIIVAADNDLKTAEKSGQNRGRETADEIYNELGIEYALCPVNSDFNDLFNGYQSQEEGYQAVAENLRKTNAYDRYAQIIDDLNDEYAVTWVGNKCMILKEAVDPRTNCKELQFTSDTDLRKYYANKTIENPEDPEKQICIIDYWWKHPDRRQYKRVVFEPGIETPGEYNLWSGFPFKPMKGDWSLFRDHIHTIIANGKDDEFHWILGWMARILQDPGGERPGTSLVLRGNRGTGKGVFVNFFGKVLGNHYLQLAQQSHLLGKFNYHLKNKILVFADEGFWAGDKQSEGAIKNMITEPELVIEQKGRDAITVRNCINLIIASNNEWVVPAGLEERRFYVTDVSSERQQDHPYFKAIAKQMLNGGLEAMLYDLLQWHYSLDVLREAPKTSALLDQIRNTMGEAKKFWYERLEEGSLSIDHVDWQEEIGCGSLYEDYLVFARSLNQRFPLTRQQFGKEINQLCKGMVTVRLNKGGFRTRVYRVPPLEECRRQFEEVVKMQGQIDWEDGPQ